MPAGHLDEDAWNVRRLCADAVHDDVRLRPRLPVGELVLDDTDGVLGDLARAARLLADASVDGAETLGRSDVLLDLADDTVLFLEREVAAAVDDDLAEVRLDIREELDTVAELAVGDLHRHEKRCGGHQGRPRPA